MQYNAAQYNAQRYDIQGSASLKSISEAVSSVDADVTQPTKVFVETLGSAVVITFSGQKLFVDVAVLDEVFRVDITNKALTDVVRLGDWLSIRRSPVNNEWFS